MMKTITVCQRKGGNGKSTASVNLAAAFAGQGKRALLIDTDDQRNSTSAIPTKRPIKHTVEDLLINEQMTVEEASETTLWEGVDLIAGSVNLSAAARELDRRPGGHGALREKLESIDGWYDVCLIDTSPSLNMLTINAMYASDGLFIPLSSNYFSLEGLAQTLEAYKKIRNALYHSLQVYGMAFVIHDGRTCLASEVQKKVKEQYPLYLCETVIGRNIKIEEAQVRRQSIFSYAPNDRGAVQYRALAGELAARMKL
jgi:chromosome partitioning protein